MTLNSSSPGEVLNQRPMSQHYAVSAIWSKRSAASRGFLLRPLSAQHLPPTIPEERGWVDRDRLLAISGRSRKEQIELSKDLGDRGLPAAIRRLLFPGRRKLRSTIP